MLQLHRSSCYHAWFRNLFTRDYSSFDSLQWKLEGCTCREGILLLWPRFNLPCRWLRCHFSLLIYISCLLFNLIPPGLSVSSLPPKRSLKIYSSTDTKRNRSQGLVLHPHIQSVLSKRAATDDFLCAAILDLLFPATRLVGDSGRG